MSLRLTSSSTIRHHLRALGSRIPHQWTNIALLLPVVIFLALYVVNERRSERIKTELEYERVVWPQYFGFPEWYGKPSNREPLADGEGQEAREEGVVPWSSLRTSHDDTERPVRVLGLIRECLGHLQSVPRRTYSAIQLPTLACINRLSFSITWQIPASSRNI
jgi:hypothetical protein